MTNTNDARLAALIPPSALADAYVNRTIWGKQDFEVFDWARKHKTNLLIKGPTQSAKTLALRAYAAARQIPVATIDVGAAMDPALTLGSHTRNSNGDLEWQDGLMTLVLRSDEGVVILDECNMAHPKVTAAYHPLGDARRSIQLQETGEIVRVTGRILLAATMNPEYIGTSPIGQAFSARWAHVPWDYDPKVEEKLLSPGMRTLAKKLRGAENVHTPVSTHLLMKFQDTISQMGYDFARELFRSSFTEDESAGLGYAFDAVLDSTLKSELEG